MIYSIHDVRHEVGEGDFNIDDVCVGREPLALGGDDVGAANPRPGIAFGRKDDAPRGDGLLAHGVHDREGVGLGLVVEHHLDCEWMFGCSGSSPPRRATLFRSIFDEVEVGRELVPGFLAGPLGSKYDCIAALWTVWEVGSQVLPKFYRQEGALPDIEV